MNEIRESLEDIKRNAEKGWEETIKLLEKAQKENNQCYRNDLVLQRMIMETRSGFADIISRLLDELERSKQSEGPVDRNFSPLVEVSEDEEDILKRFRS